MMLAILAAVGATACGAGPTGTPAATSSEPFTAPPRPAPLPGSTPPGTVLRFGEKAVITVGRAEDPHRVGVIVTGVDRATEQEMASIPSGSPDEPGRWAYLIRLIVVNEDGAGNFSGYSGPNVYGDVGEPGFGGDAGSLRLLNTDLVLSSCTDYSSPPPGWDTPGARFETCRIVFAEPDRVRVPIEDGGGVFWQP
ncbi:hypothetical protein GCM10027445_44230 [Amycolatopsis endophytica]